MAPLISYAPAGLPGVPMLFNNRTIGPTTSVTKAQTFPATFGTLPATSAAVYPTFNVIGRLADAGEIADCFNQLVARIEALEAIIGANPAVYGISAT